MSSEIKILFYILAGIVYLISTFYGKEKKKQAQRDVNKKPIDTATAEDIFEELKRSIIPSSGQLSEPDSRQAEPILPKRTERRPEISKNYNDYINHRKQPVEDTFIQEAHFIRPAEIQSADAEEKPDTAFEINFEETDPRKAFIYGEIFRRPQY